ncbi:MAG: LytTR family transcriptional regulator [Clostridiales bacterium]|uniref:LytTR family DNA-binding domain-containing protein n=1 Tax=Flavonifractor porci TaxID=3133422 RepID=UPI0030A59CA5|nr:LytTR family transcriptional regulator [Clostridiales bacterium]
MQVEVSIDEAYVQPKAVIFTAALTDDVRQAVEQLSRAGQRLITGCRGETVRLLEPAELIRVYASAGKVLAATDQGAYALRLRLYEAEAQLDPHLFVRISNSELINLKKVHSFDLSLTGTIRVKLTDGTTTYVSRRYVPKLKKRFGL